MRQVESWKPTKYDVIGGALVPSRDRGMLAVGSRLVTTLVGECLGIALSSHARGRLIDLGCGRVPLYGLYASLATSVLTVDWPASLHEESHVDLYCDVGRELPLRDAVADTIVSSDVVEHLPDPVTVFAEFARVLDAGGVLIVSTPFLYRVHEAPHDYLRHTRYSLERLARQSGLEVVEVVEVGGLLDVVADNAAKALAEVPVAGRVLASMLQWLVLAFGRTVLGQRVRSATKASFPLCHVLVAQKPAMTVSTSLESD